MSSFRFSGYVFLAIFIGILYPLGPSAKPLIGIFLSLLLFLNFCRFNPKHGNFLSWELLPALLLWAVAMPLAARAMGYALPLSMAIGLYLVAITPAAMGSPVIVHYLGGNFELSVAFVMLTSIIAPMVIPISVNAAWGVVAVSGWSIFRNVAGLIFVPLVAAILIRSIPKAKPLLTAATARSSEVFILLVYSSVATVSNKLKGLSATHLVTLSAATLTLAILQFASGYLVSREKRTRLAICVGVGQKNTGLSVWIALLFFQSEAALAPVLYIIAQHLVSGALMGANSIKSLNKKNESS